MVKADFLLTNASELATPVAPSEFGPAEFRVMRDGALAAFEGKIVWLGASNEWRKAVKLVKGARVLDAGNRAVTPGFVDCHTHPVFWATRENEFEMRVAGKSYEEIARAGGGIRASVRSLRQASKEQLVQAVLRRLDTFLAHGTTTVEAKSGYGLSLEDELKSLEVIQEANRLHPVDLVPTFLGAHEVPDEYRDHREAYIDLVIQEMLPAVKEGKLAEFCDVFCENHVFNVEESRNVLSAAKHLGFGLKLHADQLGPNGGSALAAELGAVSADHLEYSGEGDWERMLQSRVVPVMLPGAVFFLSRDHYAQAQAMWQRGLPVAVATDFNPGTCMSESMPLMLTFACLKLRLSPAQALTAATYHAALALDKGNLLGSLEVGKKADLVVWDFQTYKYLPYHFGINHTHTVVKTGRVVWTRGSDEARREGERTHA